MNSKKKRISLPSETIDFVPSQLNLADKFSNGADYEHWIYDIQIENDEPQEWHFKYKNKIENKGRRVWAHAHFD